MTRATTVLQNDNKSMIPEMTPQGKGKLNKLTTSGCSEWFWLLAYTFTCLFFFFTFTYLIIFFLN